MTPFDEQTRKHLFDFILQPADDLLILGHRLSEWCGHAPVLEEDIALGNIALDCIGQASALYQLACDIENRGRTEDLLVYFREAVEFRNLMLTELPKKDFAFTILRQFFFDAYSFYLFAELQKSAHRELAAISSKAYKEVSYHLRHSGQWVIRLGDGTSESHLRLRRALDELWMYTGEMFSQSESEIFLREKGIIPDLSGLREKWDKTVTDILGEATLTLPEGETYMVQGSRQGIHTEHLGHLLAEMQILARSYPDAQW